MRAGRAQDRSEPGLPRTVTRSGGRARNCRQGSRWVILLAVPDPVPRTMRDAHAELAKLLLEVLPAGGGSMGNQAARRAMSARLGRGVGEEEYGAVRDALVAQGRVAKGRGRGGSVRLVAGKEVAAAAGTGRPAEAGAEAGQATAEGR